MRAKQSIYRTAVSKEFPLKVVCAYQDSVLSIIVLWVITEDVHVSQRLSSS